MRVRIASRWLIRFGLFVGFALHGSPVFAQGPQGQQTLEEVLVPGTTVWITDSSGREEKTRIVGVSGDTVTTEWGDRMRHLRSEDVRRVRARRADSVLNGALIGAGVAAGAGLYFCSLIETWDVCRRNVGPLMRVGALGAGIGIGIDALIRGRKPIYEAAPSARLSAGPIVAPGAVGLRVSLGF